MPLYQKILFGIRHPIDALFFLFWINKSYSQTGEDLILKHIINKKKWFYLDIGANHPKHYNNTYYFYTQWWNWINVEPNKKLIKNFYRNRSRDINLQIAAGNWDNLIFYAFNPSTLSTCDFETAEKYQKLWYKLIDKYSVPVMSLSQIIEKYAKHKKIDILSVDVEGYDIAVLKTNDWIKYRPEYVILETVEHSKDWTWKKLNNIYDPLFANWGYEKFADTYINTIYKCMDI